MQIFRNKHHPADVVGPENWFAKSGFYRKSWFWPDSKARQKQRNESARAAERPKIISVMWWFIVDLSLECGGDLTPSLRWEHIKFHSNGRWSNSGVKKKKKHIGCTEGEKWHCVSVVQPVVNLWLTFPWVFFRRGWTVDSSGAKKYTSVIGGSQSSGCLGRWTESRRAVMSKL